MKLRPGLAHSTANPKEELAGHAFKPLTANGLTGSWLPWMAAPTPFAGAKEGDFEVDACPVGS